MKRVLLSLSVIGLLCLPQALTEAAPHTSVDASSVPIFPRAIGFGTHTFGGSGRHLREPYSRLYIIASLDDSGPGTLRQCVEASVPRTCLFARGGVIALSKDLRIRSPYITIAGQTAPAPGISLINAGIRVESHDVLIQHIAVRPGDSRIGSNPRERDAISVGAPPPRAAFNVVIDHVSLTWATDENFSTAYTNTHDVTISHSIIAEGLYRSIHPKGPHSKGILIGDGSKRISMVRNLLAMNEERNPYVKPDSSSEFVNNVVYGWGENGGWNLCNLTNNTDNDDPIQFTFVGNVYRAGPHSIRLPPVYAKRIGHRSEIFIRDNIEPNGIASSKLRAHGANIGGAISLATTPPIHAAFDTAMPANNVLTLILKSVGSRSRKRDRIDRRIIRSVQSQTGWLKDCTTGCRRPAGRVSRSRITTRALGLPARPMQDDNHDGYTNLENWLHRQARQVERRR